MQFAGGGSANHQRDVEPAFLQESCHADHLFKRWGDESAESDDVNLFVDGFLHDGFCWYHHAEVDDFVVVAGEHYADDVLSDVMNIAFDGGEEYFAGSGCSFLSGCFDVGLKDAYCALHGSCCFHDLWQKHFSAAEECAHLVHGIHEWSFDDADGMVLVLLQCFGEVGFEVVGDAFDECMA